MKLGSCVYSREYLDRNVVGGLHGCWIIWSCLLHAQDWALYSVVNRAMNWLHCPGRAAGQDLGAVQLVA